LTNENTIWFFFSGPFQYPEAKFSRTRFGNALLIDPDGFCYSMNQKKQSRIYWICNKQKKYKCRGSAITEGFYIVKNPGPDGHTHSPSPGSEFRFDDSIADVVVNQDPIAAADATKNELIN
jgi:hypothetical protein